MSRLNLTLPADTMQALQKHARGRPVARLARELIESGLARAAQLQRAQKLARDYAAGREDARAALADFEALSLELLDVERA